MRSICNILNCGNGKCIHRERPDVLCPSCKVPMVENTTNGVLFCVEWACEEEIWPKARTDRKR